MKRFVGTWRLLSYQSVFPDGSVEYPFGTAVTGMLVYTEQGHMSGQVMSGDRESLPVGYRKLGPSAAILAAFESYIAYCGTYEVDEEAGQVVHHVEASLYPNWVGGMQQRNFSFDGDLLILSAPLLRGGVSIVNQLIWKKINLRF